MTEPSDRIAALSPKRRALLAQRLRAEARVPPSSAIPRRQEEGPARLSFAQERLWFLDRWQPGSSAYNLLDAIRFTGHLDIALLAAALRDVLRRHESLRTIFVEIEGVPFQIVTPALAEPLPLIDLQFLPGPLRQSVAQALAATEGRIPFDLARGPLLRARLLRLGEDEHLLVLSMHHIVADLWSFGVLVREVGALYGMGSSGEVSPLPDLEIQYADFAVWQRAWLTGDILREQLTFWQRQLAGAPVVLDLPTDRARPTAPSLQGALVPFLLPAPLLARIKSLGQGSGATLFMVLLAAYEVLLHRHSGQEDMLLGSPIAGRTRPELEPLIGLFVNTLVLRADLAGDPSFLDLLARVRETMLEAFAHQDLPFERLVEELQPERDPSRAPLVQVMFAFQSSPMQSLELPGLTFAPLQVDPGTAKLDLSLFVTEAGDELAAAFEYSTDLFDATRVGRLAGHLREMLQVACAEPWRRLSDLPLLAPAEAQQLLEWNDRAGGYPQGFCLHELFEAQAECSPEAEAVRYEETSLSYRELELRSNQLGHWLRAQGCGPEVVVGVLLDRSLEMVVALLGILKAGGAYLPMDPSYPRDRLSFFVADSAPRLLLTASALADLVPPGIRSVFLDTAWPEIAAAGSERPRTWSGPDDLAYVIYTSGSTGRPKGAMNSHRGIVNRILWMQEAYRLDGDDRVLQKTPFSFDVSVWEFFWPLAAGAALVMARPGGHRDPAWLVEAIAREGITTLHFVPSMLRAFLEADGLERCASVRRVIASGEELTSDLTARFFERIGWAELHNLYGPTEAAVDVTAWACRPAEATARVPIGRPIANLRIHLLDRTGRPAPLGVPGELHIGGTGVGRGYLGRGEMTADRFVPDPFGEEPGGRLYRTGDLARHRSDGVVEFLGRIDHQVKIRGFRIELGEIEATLSAHPQVREAAVLAQDVGGDRRLVAYLAPTEVPSAAEMRELLREKLPDHMIPLTFVTLAALPLNPSGKIDRHALARLAPEPVCKEGRAAPSTPLEELLVGIWADVLHREPATIGREDNFFDLGGNSLSTTRVASRVRRWCGVEMPLRLLFEAPTIASLAREIATARHAGLPAAPPIRPQPGQGSLPLSFAQERLWFLDQLDPGSAVYGISSALRVQGALDLGALAASFREIVRRHDVLRTTFRTEAGVPFQVVSPVADVSLPVIDLSALPEAVRQAGLHQLANEEEARPFDLARGPLLRLALARVAEDDHVVLVHMHHIASDGWSLGVLARELVALYAACTVGEPSPLAPLSVQYADYAVWQRQWLTGDVLDAQLAYWGDRLAGAPQVLDLPADRPRPPFQSQHGAVASFTIPSRLLGSLKTLGRESHATLFMTLLAAFNALLHRYTGEERLLVGSPVAGRTHREVEDLIGFFVNTLVLRIDVAGQLPFSVLVARAREAALDAFAHQDLPFEKLVEHLQPERDPSRPPLVQVLFALQNAPVEDLELPGLTVTAPNLPTGTAKLDLSLSFMEGAGRLQGAVEYNTDLYDKVRILRLAGHLRELLEAAVVDPERPISEIVFLSFGERQQLLEWNDTAVSYPRGFLLHHLFTAQVERSPDAVAVTSDEGSLTYRELDLASDRLAYQLQAFGVGPRQIIGVLLDRSLEMMVSLLAVLKAGGAYLPLDPSYPPDRLGFFIADAAPVAVLTTSALAGLLPPGDRSRAILLDVEREAILALSGRCPEAPTDPDDLAYVIYTSGSTGRPKGAMNAHHAIVNRILWMQDAYGLGPNDRVLQKTPFSFDVSVWELFWPLMVGARLVMARPGGHRDPSYLVEVIAREGITTLHFVPSMLRTFLDADGLVRCASVCRVIASGEELPSDVVVRFFERLGWAELHNLYGPTEAAVDVTAWACHLEPRRSGVPIGRPIANLRIHLLDQRGRPVPSGIPGELHIGGIGVGRGYLRRPDLTAEKFIPDPFGAETGERLYRTGDLARYDDRGAIEFLGRIDHQVKIRGFRIELGEIEAALACQPGVREAVVLVWGDKPGDKRLVAYVVPAVEQAPSLADLRDGLRRSLPEYMVPSYVVTLESLPLNANGKVDRRALSRIVPQSAREAVGFAAPRGPIEEVLAGIWAEVLGTSRVEQVGAHDDFFALGGHSLLATQVISRVRDAFRVEMPLRALFETPTVAALAARIGQEGRGPQAPPIVPVPREGDLPLSFAQQRLWFLDRLAPDNPFYNMYTAVQLTGTLDVEALRRAFCEIVRRHEALRTTFPLMDGRPVQEIAPAPDFQIPRIDLEALSGIAPEESLRDELARLAGEEGRRPFDLARGPLLRAHLIRHGPREHTLLVNLHHIVSDGWSMGILFSEIATLYGAFFEDAPSPLPELSIQYADFAVWQREWLQGDRLEAELAYWRQQLAGIPEALELPVDHPRPAIESFRGGTQPFVLSAALVRELATLTRRHGATLSMTMLAGFQALLGRCAGREDIATGVAIANRTRREVEGLIGFFVNTLVVRSNLAGSPGFGPLLAQARETALAAYAHQDLPFERLVEELQPERALNRNPLIQVMFGYQNFPQTATEVHGLVLSPLGEGAVATGTAKFDLTLFLFEDGNRLQGVLEYNRELFEAATIRRLLGHYENLLAAAVAQPETAVALLPLLNEAERHQLTLEWNDTSSAYPAKASLQELFEAQARNTPDAPALLFDESTLSYSELNRRANRLAHHLRSLGVGPESRVGLCLERSPKMVVGLLGIVKAGGLYVPLDPDYPEERLAFMMEDSGLRVLVTEEQAVRRLPGPLVVGAELVFLGGFGDVSDGFPDRFFQDNPPVTTEGISLAYVIYTSGSTGRPKGVGVTHRAVTRLVCGTGYADFGPNQVFLQFAPISFDASTLEIWGALLNGARLALMPAHALSLEELGQALERYRVTTLWLTAGLFHQFVEHHLEFLQPVQQLLAGGDALSASHVQRVLSELPGLRLINGYGPTENTTFTCCYPMQGLERIGPSVPLGRAIANTWVHLLDPHGQPVPIGIAGELCTGGEGLARGYLRRPELTAERFIPNSFGGVHGEMSGSRLYRTGDLARYLPDGKIEFLGRIDQQVKIRGFRIEPGEIESRLGEHPAVLQNLVLAREDVPGDRRLVAYVVQNPAYEALEGEVQTEQVSQWGEIFEDLYREEASDSDPTFNIIGWNSTYTGLPLPRHEMEDWLEDTVGRIVTLDPRRVLEIGCGTGMILFRIAPGCDLYTGTDVSGRALGYVESQLGCLGLEPSRVRLLRRSAEQLDGMEADSFDTVIVNSVAQYFPSAEYLAEVLLRAAEVVRPGGSIFLGDLRSLPLLPAFHASLELFRAGPEMPLPVLRQKVQARRLQENELVIDPAFFAALRERLPKIGRVEVYPKSGRAHNELTGFRYQVVLRLGEGAETEPGAISWLDWQAEGLTLAALRRRLGESRPEVLGLRHVPNARVAEEVAAARLLWEAEEGIETAGDLRRRAADVAAGGVEPQDLWDLALELPYEVELSWASPGFAGCFEAVLRRRDWEISRAGMISALLPAPQAAGQLSQYTNNPLQGRFARRIAPELRAFLKERLPEHMVPSSFVLLDALPLTSNGKVDRRRLPAPDLARPETGRSLLAPRNPTEARLVEIWRELLGIERIGVDDDFFELGGHSLLATQAVSRVREAFGVELPLRTFFEAPSVAAVAGEVEGLRLWGGEAEVPPIVPLAAALREGPLPLSFAQERLWFLHRLETRNLAYNESAAFRMEGSLDVAALRWSLDQVLRRHESLRTTFPEVDGQAVQRIRPPVSFEIPAVDLRALPGAVRDGEARRLALGQALHPFDLARGPLVRGLLLHLGETEHAVLFSFHHIVFDGWSMGIFARELSALYGARIAGAPSPLPPLSIQYADFAYWQRQWLRGEVLERQLAYWREGLTGVAALDLATDRPRPVLPKAPSGQLPVVLHPALTRKLRAFSRSRGATPFMTLLAAFQALLHRYTGQDDVTVGSPIANRDRGEVESLIGFFVNMLVLRTDLSGDPSFGGLLDRVRQVALGAYAHQNLPFEKLVEELRPDRDLRRPPLFQVSFQLLNVPASSLDLPGLSLQPLTSAVRSVKFDLDLALVDQAEELNGILDYDADLFDVTTMQRLLAHLERLLAGALESPGRRLSELTLLTCAEHSQVILEWNDTELALGDPPCLHDMIALQAFRAPEAKAVVCNGHSLTFGELATRSDFLATHLRALGAGPDIIVALFLERSVDLVVALLAVLKAGGAYLPMDVSLPSSRLSFMLDEARAPLLLTRTRLLSALPEHSARSVCIDDLPEDADDEGPAMQPAADNLAYVLYTSGSTGRPKGVTVTHRGLSNYLLWARDVYPAGEERGAPVHSPISFDLTVTSLFLPLLAGRCAVLVPEEEGVDGLAAALAAGSFGLVKLTPAHLEVLNRMLPPERASGCAGAFVIGGEPLFGEQLAFWRSHAQGIRLINEYGPTETVVGCCVYEIPTSATLTGGVPVGRPIANTRVQILDPRLSPVPIGVPGELYIGGAGVCRGYLHRPDLTAERFVPDPFTLTGERLYRTGDLARYLSDGNIELLGRLDHQVKVRGFRIELGEIEAVLVSVAGVREAVVMAREDTPGDQRLVAYVVGDITADALRQSLRERLPDYMVPAAFVTLARLPLTPNGKVDRKALPAPEWQRTEESYLAPRTPVEEILAEIWGDLLGFERISVHDNFFEIGGHSLLAVFLMDRIEKRFGKGLPLATLFAAPTLESLAALLSRSGSQPRRSPLVAIKPKGDRVPFFCVHPVGGNVLCYLDLARHLAPEQPFYALQSPDPGEGEGLPTSLEEMATRYLRELRRIQPEGPYRLGGWSMGGLVAFEMARQLEREGQEVDLVALLDTLPPGVEPGPPATEEELVAWFAQDLARLLGHEVGISPEDLPKSPMPEKLDHVARLAHASGLLPEDFDLAQIKPLFATFAANFQASRSYEPQPYPGCLALWFSEQTLAAVSPHLPAAWNHLALGGIETSTLAGDHYSLLRRPQVERLAQELTARLAAAAKNVPLRCNR